jgi:hypothetical protein
MSYATAALASQANALATLDHLVTKASAHEKGEALLQSRLAEDMHPLHAQIRITVTQVLITLDRLGDLGLELDESDIGDFAEARARIAKARELVGATQASALPAHDAVVEFDLPNGMAFTMQAHEYCRDWALPQLYFHLVAAYAILRMEGVEIGKADYVPHMMRYLKAPPAR